MKAELRLGHLCAPRGTKLQGMVEIYETGLSFPVTLVNGNKEGKTVLLTGGIHGAEYPGIQTIIELAAELSPEETSGRLILIHPVNTEAFRKRVSEVVPQDGKNLNRVFPGNKEGTVTEQIAHFITYECQSQADFYIDLHGGDLYEQSTHFVYYPGMAAEEVMMASREIAKALETNYMVRSRATTGAYNSAAVRGLPSLLIERGGRGSWTQEEIISYKRDIKAALHALGVLEAAEYAIYKEKETTDITKAVYLESKLEGCWYPAVSAGEYVEKGQLLGSIKDFFGKPLETYYAEISGIILYMTTTLSVNVDSPLIAYGECEV